MGPFPTIISENKAAVSVPFILPHPIALLTGCARPNAPLARPGGAQSMRSRSRAAPWRARGGVTPVT